LTIRVIGTEDGITFDGRVLPRSSLSNQIGDQSSTARQQGPGQLTFKNKKVVFVRLGKGQELNDRLMVKTAHNGNLFKNVGTLEFKRLARHETECGSNGEEDQYLRDALALFLKLFVQVLVPVLIEGP
jgi:hypothetical protein